MKKYPAKNSLSFRETTPSSNNQINDNSARFKEIDSNETFLPINGDRSSLNLESNDTEDSKVQTTVD